MSQIGMKRKSHFVSILSAAVSLLIGTSAFADVDLFCSASSYVRPNQAELDPQLISSFNYAKKSQQEEADQWRKLTPTDLQNNATSGEALSKIADRSWAAIMNSPQFQNNPVGSTAIAAEKKMKQDVNLGDSNGVKQKLTFQVQAFQSQAKMDYSGYTNASVKVNARDSSVNFEVWEPLHTGQQVVVSQMVKPDDRISSIAMRWNF